MCIDQKKNEIGFSFYTTQKSTQNEGLNLRSKAMQFLEETMEWNLYDFALGNDFLNMTSKA